MSPADVRTERVTVAASGRSIDVSYRVAGEGPPLVCVHGIGMDAATVGWRDAPTALADRATVHVLDLPNHGASDAAATVRTTADYVDVLGAFLDETGLEGATLAGLSMGGAVVLGHALDGGDPERLILVDSYGLGADAPWRSAAGLAVRIPFADGLLSGSLSSRAGVESTLASLVGDGLPEGLVDDVLDATEPAAIRAMRRWQRHEFRPDGLRTDYRDALSDLAVPTLLIHGERDPLLPVSWSAAAHDRLPDSELHRLSAVGHWPPREATATVYEAVGSFVSGG